MLPRVCSRWPAAVLALLFVCGASAVPAAVSVLVFSKTAGYRHEAIEVGVEALREIARGEGWRFRATEDAAFFTAENLNPYTVVVFLNTTGDVLDDAQMAVLRRHIRRGRGFVGVHAATDTEHNDAWFQSMIGGEFHNHPRIQEATLRVHQATGHPTIGHLSTDTWVRTDEWYNFQAPPPRDATVVLSLDESSYTGGNMGASHPLAWAREFEGGRVFYTGLGHTLASYADPDVRAHLREAMRWSAFEPYDDQAAWRALIDIDLSQWETWLGVPPEPLRGLTGGGDTPIGLNRDPLGVFAVYYENGFPVVRIGGQVAGGLVTRESFGNYHFKAEVRWGERKYEPRLDAKRNSGILFHARGEPGASQARAWPESIEFQVQEDAMGDYGAVEGAHRLVADMRATRVGDAWYWDPQGELTEFQSGEGHHGSQLKRREGSFEAAHGEWTTVEIITVGNSAIYVVGGKIVNVVRNVREVTAAGTRPLAGGPILLQSEGAEVYYRNMGIRMLTRWPAGLAQWVEE